LELGRTEMLSKNGLGRDNEPDNLGDPREIGGGGKYWNGYYTGAEKQAGSGVSQPDWSNLLGEGATEVGKNGGTLRVAEWRGKLVSGSLSEVRRNVTKDKRGESLIKGETTD